jgi:hypothetical protein
MTPETDSDRDEFWETAPRVVVLKYSGVPFRRFASYKYDSVIEVPYGAIYSGVFINALASLSRKAETRHAALFYFSLPLH